MFKKIKNFNNWLIVILCPLSVLIFLIVIIIRPLLLIRFGEILIYRFGHSLINVEIFLQNKKTQFSKCLHYEIPFYSGLMIDTEFEFFIAKSMIEQKYSS